MCWCCGFGISRCVMQQKLGGRTAMYIMSLGVVTEYRRCGIAKKLVNHVVAHALRFRECTAVGCSHHGAWPYACRVASLNMSRWWYRCSCMCCGPMQEPSGCTSLVDSSTCGTSKVSLPRHVVWLPAVISTCASMPRLLRHQAEACTRRLVRAVHPRWQGSR